MEHTENLPVVHVLHVFLNTTTEPDSESSWEPEVG